jgi:hypothetical protein
MVAKSVVRMKLIKKGLLLWGIDLTKPNVHRRRSRLHCPTMSRVSQAAVITGDIRREDELELRVATLFNRVKRVSDASLREIKKVKNRVWIMRRHWRAMIDFCDIGSLSSSRNVPT